MLPVQFCNYNLDYQQRLGFLKLTVWAGETVRGGKEELQRRIEALYVPSARKSARSNRPGSSSPAGRENSRPLGAKGWLDPEALLQHDEIPSWQPGFTFQRLDRLVLWAEMLGLVTPAGRLAEWAKPLSVEKSDVRSNTKMLSNPFLLSRRDRAYFLALLAYHDQVLLHLVSSLSHLGPGVRVEVRDGCIETAQAIGRTLDCVSGTNIRDVRTRQALRSLLQRMAAGEHLSNKFALCDPEERVRALQQMKDKSTRNHLAEYHAVCRFEQLTDLGLLVKDDPRTPPTSVGERERSRKSWVWYTTESLDEFGRCIRDVGCNVEDYLQSRWSRSCLLDHGYSSELNAGRDQREIAILLDNALPRARRQLGAIQVHTWVFIAALDAIDQGFVLEFDQAYSLLDAMRHDQRYSDCLRQSGQQTYLGRTALVMGSSLQDYVCRYPIKL